MALPWEFAAYLYVSDKNGLAVGIYVQMLGSEKHPVACFFQTVRWYCAKMASCLRALAATALLTAETSRISLGQQLEVFPPF